MSRIGDTINLIGSDSQDSEELARAKRVLVITSILITGLSLIWILLYWINDELLAASIPAFYVVITTLQLVWFSRSLDFPPFRDRQVAMYLLLPVALQFVLGGFANSGAVALWALVAPLAALLFISPAVARRLFVGYLALIVLSTLAQPLTRSGNNLPPVVVTIFFVIDIGAVSLVVFFIINRFVNLLSAERAKSELLLLNVLPDRIARRLREEPDRVIAERFDSATVLFADVVGFTPLSAGLEPEQLVETLNQIFSDFDALADKHGAEKIKTIGDSYMAAAGVPTPRPDHAAAIANLALDMAEYCVARPDRSGTSLRFRIGINSGPIVAGVIGRKKFSYDLWGDTVNTAARMESQAEPGTIQMTESSCNLLRDAFICQERGVIDVKGKGLMPVWILVGRKT